MCASCLYMKSLSLSRLYLIPLRCVLETYNHSKSQATCSQLPTATHLTMKVMGFGVSSLVIMCPANLIFHDVCVPRCLYHTTCGLPSTYQETQCIIGTALCKQLARHPYTHRTQSTTYLVASGILASTRHNSGRAATPPRQPSLAGDIALCRESYPRRYERYDRSPCCPAVRKMQRYLARRRGR